MYVQDADPRTKDDAAAQMIAAWGGGVFDEHQGGWILDHPWIGRMEQVIGETESEYEPLVGNLRLDLLRTKNWQTSVPQLTRSHLHDSSDDIILHHKGLPRIDDLRDREQCREILLGMDVPSDANSQKDGVVYRFVRDWFEVIDEQHIRVLHISFWASRLNGKLTTIEPRPELVVVREGVFRQLDPSNTKDAMDFPSVKQQQAGKQATIDASCTPQQGEFGPLMKWLKYPYEIATSYPCVESLPTPDKIPEILEFIEKKMGDGGGVPESQLPCLTRMSFGRLDLDDSQSDRLKAWQDWWKQVGEDYFRRVESEGKRNPEAWKLLVGDANIRCPEYKILIPSEWRFEINFRSGDYDGVQREVIVMERTKETATLKRHYSVDSRAPFQYEVWHNFTPEEADRFLYGLGYAIDQPWFVKRFIYPPQTSHWDNIGHVIEGRNWGTYNPHASWSGIVLPDGRVFWNDDPKVWHLTEWRGIDFDDLSVDYGYGLVYPFVCYHFPEKQSVDGNRGWKVDPNPPSLEDQPKNDWTK